MYFYFLISSTKYTTNFQLCLNFFLNIVVFPEKCWQHLGCWRDTGNRTIKGVVARFYDDPINECRDYAAGKGYTVFAIESDDECFTAADAGETYMTYGASNNCRNGVGSIYEHVFETSVTL